MNIKSALLHVTSDMLGSLAATILGVVIIYTGWIKIDPFLSLFISVLLLRATYRLIKQSEYILIVSDRVKSPGNNRQNSPGKNGEFTIKTVL